MLIDKWQYPGIRRLSIKWSSHSSNLTQPVEAQWTNSTYMLYRAEIRRDGDAKQSYMITDHWPWQSHLRAVVAVHCYQAKLNRSLLRTSPEELRLVSVQLESVCCHPVSHICNTQFKSLAGRRHVLALTPQVQLRVISVGLEVNIMCFDYSCKVRRV